MEAFFLDTPYNLWLFSPESDLLQVEGVLNNASGRDPHSEYVLLRGKIVGESNTVDIRQVTEIDNNFVTTVTKVLNIFNYICLKITGCPVLLPQRKLGHPVYNLTAFNNI